MKILKENLSTLVKKAIFGDYSGKIKTFCTMTPENPMKREVSPEENNKLTKQFKSLLKRMNIKYAKIYGMYDNKEKSYMLYNITLKDAKFFSKQFNQESFIFGKSSIEDAIDIAFYVWDGKDYIMQDSVNNVVSADDFVNYYSRHGDFKYNFPFDLGESFEDVDISYLDKCLDESLISKARTNARAHFYKKGYLY